MRGESLHPTAQMPHSAFSAAFELSCPALPSFAFYWLPLESRAVKRSGCVVLFGGLIYFFEEALSWEVVGRAGAGGRGALKQILSLLKVHLLN